MDAPTPNCMITFTISSLTERERPVVWTLLSLIFSLSRPLHTSISDRTYHISYLLEILGEGFKYPSSACDLNFISDCSCGSGLTSMISMLEFENFQLLIFSDLISIFLNTFHICVISSGVISSAPDSSAFTVVSSLFVLLSIAGLSSVSVLFKTLFFLIFGFYRYNLIISI